MKDEADALTKWLLGVQDDHEELLLRVKALERKLNDALQTTPSVSEHEDVIARVGRLEAHKPKPLDDMAVMAIEARLKSLERRDNAMKAKMREWAASEPPEGAGDRPELVKLLNALYPADPPRNGKWARIRGRVLEMFDARERDHRAMEKLRAVSASWTWFPKARRLQASPPMEAYPYDAIDPADAILGDEE